ncbi:TetR/AcrR family transcriptional regulator C-terminal domain-containing protein [Gemmatimonas phototrophica]|uniref:Transcriptional regulator TetR C-terminal Proteobacteria type domain-containing protein n=1 Tax=Gemmatimonas phototrophica TaxID=1379270 RepID=A0A143BIN4_9BACT|nr:TetR/AcrR family transcriptional regulator [Gemmatimonas phototrophica]AMW04441.1 hypothetical protein GEMMAAP_05480 [Gemmatimonas phototrophica]
MAAAAEVSLGTLRHYFTDRRGVLRAVLEHQHQVGQPFLMQIAAGDLPGLEESASWFLTLFAEGLRSGVSRTLMVGLTNGMAESDVARACLAELLEPTIGALEVRLARHVARGDMRHCDTRSAALTLLGPLVLGYFHQAELDGRTYRPLDLEAFIADQSAMFARAYGAERDPS